MDENNPYNRLASEDLMMEIMERREDPVLYDAPPAGREIQIIPRPAMRGTTPPKDKDTTYVSSRSSHVSGELNFVPDDMPSLTDIDTD